MFRHAAPENAASIAELKNTLHLKLLQALRATCSFLELILVSTLVHFKNFLKQFRKTLASKKKNHSDPLRELKTRRF